MQELNQFPMVYQQPVIWGDMDALGHVNNVIYYRYIESARIAYFQSLDLFSYGVMLVISQSSCRYLSSVIYPDTLYIGTQMEEIRQSAMRMSYVLYSEQQNKIVATGEAVMVCLDPNTQQKVSIPEQLKTDILNIEAKVNRKPLMP